MRKSTQRKLFVAAATVVSFAGGDGWLRADTTQALYTITGTQRNNYTGVVGGAFTTGANETAINAFGFYDPAGAAFVDAFFDNTSGMVVTGHRVGIYSTLGVGSQSTAAGTLLAYSVVDNSGAFDASNNFRWANNLFDGNGNPISSFTLAANSVYVIGAEVTSGGDKWIDGATPTWNSYFVGSNSTTSRGGRYSPGGATWPVEPKNFLSNNSIYGSGNVRGLALDAINWDGGGSDNNLSTAGNWVGDVTPDLVTGIRPIGFAGTARTSVNVDIANANFAGIKFDATAGSFTLGGNGFAVGGGIANNSVNTQTFSTTGTISMRGQSVDATNGNLVFNSTIDLGASLANAASASIIFGGTKNVVLNGKLTGGGGVVLNNPNVQITNNANDYNGATTINAGTFAITPGSNHIFGSTTGVTSLASGASTAMITLSGDVNLAEPINFASRNNNVLGPGTGFIPNIRSAGNNVLSGAITVSGANTPVEVTSGFLTMSGPLTGTANGTLLLQGNGDGEISGPITDSTSAALGITKSGTGTWTLSNPTKTNKGATNVLAGKIIVTGAPLTGSSITVEGGATLDLSGISNYSLPGTQLLQGRGVVKAATLNVTDTNGIRPGNDSAGNAGTLPINGNLSVSSSTATPTGSMSFDLTSAQTMGGGVNDLLDVSGNLTTNETAGSLNRINIVPLTGTLGAGTYTLIKYGGTRTGTAADWTLSMTSGLANYRQSFAVTESAGQVNLSVTGTEATLTWSGTNSSVWDVNTTANWNGGTDKFFHADNVVFGTTSVTSISLSGTPRPGSVLITADAPDLTWTGALGGGGTITKNSAGTLTLPQTMTFSHTGAFVVNAGTIALDLPNNQTLASSFSGTGNLAKVGGNLNMDITGSSPGFSGKFYSNTGRTFVRQATGLGNASAQVFVASGSAVYVLNTLPGTFPVSWTINGTGAFGETTGALRFGGAANVTFSGPVTLAGNANIGCDAGAATASFTNTISGPGMLTKTGGAVLELAASNSYTGGTTASAGTLLVSHPSALAGGTVTINGGIVQLAPSLSQAVKTPALSITSGRLDLTNNPFIVDYTGASVESAVRAGLLSGYAAGSWNGSGITSSSAAATASSANKTAIGYAEASRLGVASFGGQSVDSGAVLLRYTYFGDSNLDGRVNALDFNAVATNFGSSGKVWLDGDYNYDGTVNTQDFTALAANFNASLPAAPALGSLVPEPASMALLGIGAVIVKRRRRGV